MFRLLWGRKDKRVSVNECKSRGGLTDWPPQTGKGSSNNRAHDCYCTDQIRSLNYIQQKDRTARQGRCCYHLDHVKEWCLLIVSKWPFNRESCYSGSIVSIGHDCCPSAVFTEGAQRRVWTTSNPLKYERTHWIPWKAGDNLERAQHT